MPTYSHSKLGTFQQCRYKYKLKYIDKVKVPVPDTIETFMGKLVHAALEKLYKDLQHQHLTPKEDLLQFFAMRWEEEYDEKILNNSDYPAENFREMGKKFIADYYDHYTPFNHWRTIGIETEDRLQLNNAQYHIRIDRLACDQEGNYYVCDYKTNKKLKAQEELDEDRQLAMYSLWVKQNFKDCKSVKLIWYFLAFDKEMVSERSEQQLKQLKASTEALIHEIERCEDFPTTVTSLCNWCEYKPQCPAWRHEAELKEKTPEAFKEDDGVKFVDEYSKWDAMEKEAEEQKEAVREKLIAFSQQKGIEAVWGTEKKASIKSFDKIEYPKTEEFIGLLKKKGIYEEVVSINNQKLLSTMRKHPDDEVLDKLKKDKGWRVSLSKR